MDQDPASLPPIPATPGADELIGKLIFDAEAAQNPVPLFHQMRELGRITHSSLGTTFLSGYEECQSVFRDNRFGKLPPTGAITGGEVAAVRRKLIEEHHDGPTLFNTMLFQNQPEHTRQRGLVARAFTPRRVQALRSRIADLADRYVEDLIEKREADLLEVVGFPTPAAVVGSLVGVPDEDWPLFRRTVTQAAATLEPAASDAELELAYQAGGEINAYFLDLVGQRRRQPADDLTSALLAVDEDGERLGDNEIVSIITLLFAAGFETTTNLIGNGMVALLKHPDQMERLWSNPDMVPSAVEEMLRWDSPVQFDSRRPLADADLFGLPVETGRVIILLIGAANRDPEQFPNPDEFDIGRDHGPALSFAAGIHYCLGANLARAEGQEVFRSLIERCSSIELAGDLVRRHRLTLQGYEAVPVRVAPR